jgi:hypothetical protein
MVAERMHAVEIARPEDKVAAEENCTKVILELWRHRDVVPKRVRPLRELEPVLRTLLSLDVEQADYRHYPEVLRAAEYAEAPEDVRQWLKLAIGLDYTARLLIGSALRSAASGAVDQAVPWIELMEAGGIKEEPESFVIKFVSREKEEPKEDHQITSMREKLSRLENFTRLAQTLAEEIRARLPIPKS